MKNAQIRTLEQYLELQQNIASYHVTMAAARNGVLQALENGQKTVQEIADACELEVIPVRLLLGVLIETKLIEKYDEYYALAPVTRLLPDLKELDDSQWGSIDQWLQGKSDVGVADSDPLSSQIADPQWMLTPAAMDAADVLDIGQSRKGMRVLEVAGGACVLSATLAFRDPTCQFVIVDLPQGILKARETVENISRSDQFEFMEADPFDPPIEAESIDLVIVSGVLRKIQEDTSRAWLSRLRQLLKPNGEVVVLDWFPGQEEGTRNLRYNQLELNLRYRHGGLISPALLKEWLEDSSFKNVRYAALPSTPHIWGLVLAENSPLLIIDM